MFTDIYFTNLTALFRDTRIIFFQKNVAEIMPNGIVFKAIEKCAYGWSHNVRIWWNLSFKLVKSSGNTTYAYPLKTVYGLQKTKFLIWKEGIVSVTQNYGNGNQIIDFEQIKGTAFSGIQVYRGKLLVAEHYFSGKFAKIQINTMVSIAQSNNKNGLEIIEILKNKSFLDLDFESFKEVHLSLQDTKDTTSKLIVHQTKKW